YDKVVIYFKDVAEMKEMALLLSKTASFFSETTPLFSHQIIPGISYSMEPNKTEVINYNFATKEGKELISFGQWMSYILAKNMILVLHGWLKNKPLFNSLKEMRKTDMKRYYDSLGIRFKAEKKEFAKELISLLERDAEFKKFLSDFEKIEKEIKV
ncbi:MAG: T3SS effector HopA1 family protein, partial [Nanoarchaeota archaeon]|nr:T3SS effector HopA1 family protein [Nanoarchaeota archaeon]